MKKLIIIFCAVFAIFGMTSCKSPSPSDTVKEYYSALQKPDYQKALSCTDITDQDEIQKQLEKLEGFETKIVDYEILSETISEDGKSAVVETKYSMTSSFNKEPKEDTKKLDLVKVDGKWKIHE